jgi:hypothetical protein
MFHVASSPLPNGRKPCSAFRRNGLAELLSMGDASWMFPAYLVAMEFAKARAACRRALVLRDQQGLMEVADARPEPRGLHRIENE